MALKMEFYDQKSQKWIELPPLEPGQRPGSVSHNTPEGRDVYLFMCHRDNSKSAIYKAGPGADYETHGGAGRIVDADPSRTLLIKELRTGDSPYELSVRTDRSGNEFRRLRFTHI